MQQQVYIVIPVFNNADSIVPLYEGIRRAAEVVSERFTVTVRFVNDASTDDSGSVIDSLKKKNGPKVDGIDLPRNSGQIRAITTGLKEIGETDLSVIMSADLQDPPEMIVALLENWEPGIDMVVAMREGHSNFTSGIFHRIVHFFYPDYPMTGFDVALLAHGVRQAVIARSDRPQFLQIEMLKASGNTKAIRYEKKARPSGRSQWSFMRRLAYLMTFLYYYTRFFPVLFLAAVIGAAVFLMLR